MQNALQNPHYKKIWEEVNWKIRHPEAKSLEEALKFERKEPLNLLVAYSWPRDRIFTSVEYNTRNFDNGMARVECVLGRPITLEDILLLLKNQISTMSSWEKVEDKLRKLNPRCCTAMGKSTKYTYNSYTQAYLRIEHGRIVCENVLFVGLMIEVQRFWQLTKPLHEQTPETWEKIANLI